MGGLGAHLTLAHHRRPGASKTRQPRRQISRGGLENGLANPGIRKKITKTKNPPLFAGKIPNGKSQIKMKASIVITLIIMGGLLILAPVISLERQRDRVAEF
jgi:hypothetical protein